MYLSIIIPVYNAHQTLSKTLDSLFNNDIVYPFEIIIVDDQSTDHSVEIAKKYNVQILSTPTNSGPAHARNLGATKSSGELLLFADSDVVFRKNTINNLIKHYENHKKLGQEIVCGGHFEKKSINTGFGPKLIALQSFYFFQKNFTLYGNGQSMPEAVFQSYCGLINKNLFMQIGMFNTKYRIAGGEEVDLGFRLQSNKTPMFVFYDCPLGHHFRPISKILKVNFKRGINYLMTKKNYPQPMIIYGIDYIEILNLLTALLFIGFLGLSIFSIHWIYLSLIFLVIHLSIYHKFYFKYLFPEQNLFFLVRTLGVLQLVYFVKALSAGYALFSIYIMKKEFYY